MAAQTDTYRATTLADARAAALQAIETMWEDGFASVRIHADREDGLCAIAVTYMPVDAAEPAGGEVV